MATSERASGPAFVGVTALLFVSSVTLTIAWCRSMSALGGMSMPGGWTMTMAWMRMPGQTWPGAAATFVEMWVVMMVAMMLPSLVPMLRRYREAMDRAGHAHLGLPTVLAGIGYFAVWTLFGVAVFPMGVALTTVEMEQPALARAVPVAIAAVVLLAGLVQFTSWKAHQLRCCRAPQSWPRRTTLAALRHGVRLGVDCVRCCGSLMTITLVLGVMDVGVMATVGALITAERLAPGGERVARAIGVAVSLAAVGLWWVAAGGPDSP